MQRKGIHDQGTRMRWKRDTRHGHKKSGNRQEEKNCNLITIDEEKGSQPTTSSIELALLVFCALCYNRLGFPFVIRIANVDRLCVSMVCLCIWWQCAVKIVVPLSWHYGCVYELTAVLFNCIGRILHPLLKLHTLGMYYIPSTTTIHLQWCEWDAMILVGFYCCCCFIFLFLSFCFVFSYHWNTAGILLLRLFFSLVLLP